MVRLTVVSGPMSGAIYEIENSATLGRQSDCSIVLSGFRVSKQHARLEVVGSDIKVLDQGSRNGTLVNGRPVREAKLRNGDRITIGEFTLEVKKITPPRAMIASAGSNQAMSLQIPESLNYSLDLGNSPIVVGNSISASNVPGVSDLGNPIGAPIPLSGSKNIFEKLIFIIDRHVMPLVYGLSFRYDFKVITFLTFGILSIGTVVLSVQPILDANKDAYIKEAKKRSRLITRQMVERNNAFFASGTPGRSEIGSLGRDGSVRSAVIVDLKLQVVAPGELAGRPLSDREMVKVARSITDKYESGEAEVGLNHIFEETDSLISIEPIKIFDARLGKNIVKAMAIVSLDLGLMSPDFGLMGMIYSEALIYALLLTVFLAYLYYKVLAKQFLVLNDEIDRALKGELQQVTHEFIWEDLDPLFDVINSTLQRSSSDGTAGGASVSLSGDDVRGSFQSLIESNGAPMALCDGSGALLSQNEAFFDVTGVRSDGMGSSLASQARDQAFGSLVQDLITQVAQQGSVAEAFEFSGLAYKVVATGIGNGTPAGILFTLVRGDG